MSERNFPQLHNTLRHEDTINAGEAWCHADVTSLMYFRGAGLPKQKASTLQFQKRKQLSFSFEDSMTLKQACPSEYQEAQGAFKDSMIHGILQFTLRIAFRCVLHRCESQEIHC
jgi:hypothetical protein